MFRKASLFLLVLSMAVPISGEAIAHGYKFGEIAVGHIWAPPSDGKTDGAPVYGPFLNRGKTPERILGASAPIAESVRFRVVKDGKTDWPDSIELAPGKPLALARWRVHLWLTGLKRPLKDGDSFDLVLNFAHAGRHTVKVVVERSSSH
jgi:copper(I)-binding protein